LLDSKSVFLSTKSTKLKAENYAERLRRAFEERKAIDPLRNEIGLDNLNFAYEIQDINTKLRIQEGARVVGKKIGLTSKAVQKQLGVDQPDYGILFHDMEVLNGSSISVKEMMQPKVEAEVAFVLGDDLDGEGITIVDLLASIDYALPAIEIVGSRIKDWDIKITDTIADNASASHYVLGHTPRTLDEFDVIECKMQMKKNNEIVSEGTGAACLGSPLNATLWLANKMIELGNPLKAGELIFSGAIGPMSNVTANDRIFVNIEGLGHVSVSFEE